MGGGFGSSRGNGGGGGGGGGGGYRSMLGGGGGGPPPSPSFKQTQYNDEGDMAASQQQTEQQAQYMKASRSGIRRFSATSMPHLHNNTSSSPQQQQQQDPYGNGYEEEEEDTTRYRVLQLDQAIAEMYTGVKSHVKTIKKLQRETDKKWDQPHDDGQPQRAARPPPTLDVEYLIQQVRTTLDSGGLSVGSKIWYKQKKWYQTSFEFKFPDPGDPMSPTVALVMQNKKKTENITLRFNTYSGLAMLPEEEPNHEHKSTASRNSKVKNKYELHVRTNQSGEAIPIIMDTQMGCNAMKQAINVVVQTLRQFQSEKVDYQNNPQPVQVDPLEMADKAQCFDAYGAGLYDAVVGEKASFEITAKDEDNNSFTLDEMQNLLPPQLVTTEYGEEFWTDGHMGSNMRLNIQLFSMTEEEFNNADYSRLELDKMDTNDLVKGGLGFQRARNIGKVDPYSKHSQYGYLRNSPVDIFIISFVYFDLWLLYLYFHFHLCIFRFTSIRFECTYQNSEERYGRRTRGRYVFVWVWLYHFKSRLVLCFCTVGQTSHSRKSIFWFAGKIAPSP